MPIYEYECTSCHHHFDLMQKISDPPATQCPKCLENSVIKLVSAAGFQLKGTGWYATDFKNKGIKDKPASDKPENSNKKEESSSTSTSTSQESAAADTSKTSKGDAE